MAFFEENKESLESLYIRYAMGDAPAAGAASWKDIQESLTSMSEREFMKVTGEGAVNHYHV